MRGNTITIELPLKRGKVSKTIPLYQYDYGQKLIITDVELPSYYEVHFSNEMHGDAVTSIGDSTGVEIPDSLLATGENVYLWLYLHDSDSDGETEFQGAIPVIKRAKVTDQTPTPHEQSVIEQAINALNGAVETAVEEATEAAIAASQAAQEAAEEAAQDAEAARDAAQAAAGDFQGISADAVQLESDEDPTIAVNHSQGGLYHFSFGIPKGVDGTDGTDGTDGVTFTPSVSSEGVISWTNDGERANPQSVNIKGPKGDTGDPAPSSAVVPAVEAWLEENVAQETGYVLDRSLQASNAAAPADLVGDLKNAIDNYQIVTSYERKGLSTSDGSESSATNKVSSGFYPCSMATLVRVKGKMNGISVAFRAYFYDSNKTYICNIESSLTDIETEDLMCAFVKSAYVRFMFYSTDISIELLPENITSRFSVSYRDNNIFGKEKEEIDNTGIVRCNWCYGSAYAASGLPYMDRSRAISRPIPVKENEILQINCDTGTSLRIFKFKSDGTFISYSNTTHPQNYITETNVAYIVIGQQSITNIETAQNTVFVRKNSSEEKRILDTLITNPVGIIPVLWDRGGLLVATGEEISSSTRIRSGFIPVPASRRIMIHNPNAKFTVRIFAYDSNSVYQQDYQAGVHGSVEENYFTDFDILLKDNISYIRILARKNENPETTVLDKNDGKEIIVYSETGLNHFDYDDEYADYVLEETNNVMDKLDIASSNTFTLLAVSDMHFWYNSNMVSRSLNDMKNAVKYIRMIENPDIVVSFGDVIYRWYAQYLYSAGKNEMLASVKILNDAFENHRQLRLVGNHDANSLQKDKYFSMSEIFKYIGSHNTDVVIDDQNTIGGYGYTDIENKKMRIVYLNTSDFTDEGAPPFEPREQDPNINSANLYYMSSRQVKWFADTIKLSDKSDADEWTLVVLSHIPLDESTKLEPNVGMNVFLLLTDRKTLASHSYTVKEEPFTVDYTNCEKLKDIIYIHGHNHDYDLSATDGIVKAGIPNALPLRNAQSMSKVALTKDSTAFCVLKFDLANKVIHAIHYGKGYDRVVHYNEMEVSASTTLTAIQTNTGYVSSDTSVATVTSGGVISPVATGYAYITGTDANGNKEMWNIHVTV